MTARAPRVLMPGPAPEGRGGVAALVALLGASGLFEQARVRSASTRGGGSFFSRLEAAARGACLWRRPAIGHAHAASQASIARKSLLLWLAHCAGCQTIFHLHGGGFRQFATVRSGLLKKGLAQLVELTGWLEPAVREQQLNRAAVFCLPSHAEGLPMALLETMAAGKAVVASRVGGIPEAVRDGENGLLVPPRDAQALATALARVPADAGLRARLGERARDTVAQHDSIAAICGRLAAIHNDLAGAR
jgi:hypothetical protein